MQNIQNFPNEDENKYVKFIAKCKIKEKRDRDTN